MTTTSVNIKAAIERSVQLSRAGDERLSLKNRLIYLDRMLKVLRKYADVITDALQCELGRETYDSYIFELLPLVRCLKYLKKNLPRLTSEKRVRGRWFTFPARYSTIQEPYGVVYIQSCWNYPFLLALEPVAGAIAAGNRVVLKLPVRVPRCVALVKKIVDEVFLNGEVIIVVDELDFSEIIRSGCDYIFYTGNPGQAADIMRVAAEKLIPATLELGGKNPCIIDEGADIVSAAKRIVWGKFTNSGQTCIAPDYLIVHKHIKEKFLYELAARIRKKYGEYPLSESGCCKIVDANAYQRLDRMILNGRLVTGGEKDPETNRISPTVIDQVNDEDPILQEEVFGPLLGVVEFDDTSDIQKIIRHNSDPLAIYYFGKNADRIKLLETSVRSGSLCINDCLLQFANESAPFGGIGKSGMGAYHGARTFYTFSHTKSVVRQSRWFELNFRYSGCKIKEKIVKYLFLH